MTGLRPSSILATLLIVVLTHSVCDGVKRTASDYLTPLYKAKGLNPAEIKRDALWFLKTFQTYTTTKNPYDRKDFLNILRERIIAGLTPTSEYPDLELRGLSNESFKVSGKSIKFGARSRVILKIIDSLLSISDSSCKFDHWLTLSQLFYSLFEIPDEHAVLIHEAGMKFAAGRKNQPRTQLYRYIKYLTSLHLARCLKDVQISTGGIGEAKIDQVFAEGESALSLTDQELWRAAFKSDIKQRDVRTLSPASSSKQSWTDHLISLLALIESKPEVRKTLEKSAGMITLAMALAPEELEKFRSLSFTLSKQVEYLRLLNQHLHCEPNCTFVRR